MNVTPHEHVHACCDRCGTCGHRPRLIAYPEQQYIECTTPTCCAWNTVHAPELAEAMRLWNLQQRALCREAQ